MERKIFKADNIQLDDKGHINFRFAKLNVRDKGGDIIPTGAIQNGKTVLLSSWNHTSWGNGLTVGKGTITEKDGYLTFDGQFNLNTQAGRDHYETVKFNGDIQEYSFGFDVLAKSTVQDSETGDEIRSLDKMDVFEASPVLLGQGVDTGTNSIKQFTLNGKPIIGNSNDDTKSRQFKTHAEDVLSIVTDFANRAQNVAEIRVSLGKSAMNELNTEILKDIAMKLNEASKSIASVLHDDSSDSADTEISALFAQIETNNLMRSL